MIADKYTIRASETASEMTHLRIVSRYAMSCTSTGLANPAGLAATKALCCSATCMHSSAEASPFMHSSAEASPFTN